MTFVLAYEAESIDDAFGHEFYNAECVCLCFSEHFYSGEEILSEREVAEEFYVFDVLSLDMVVDGVVGV